MSWRTVKKEGDLITAQDHNEEVAYIINHKLEHHQNGEQPIDHNLLVNYEINRHRKIVDIPMLGWLVIEI